MRFFVYNSTCNLQLILTRAYSAHVTEEVGKYDSFTADVPVDSINLDAINGYYVGVPIRDTNSFKLFKLERPSVSSDAITLTGIDAAAYDLKTQGAATQIDEKAIPLENALDHVFDNTTWSYSLLQGDYEAQPLTFEAGSKKALLDKIKEQWGLTAQFTYDVKNNEITNRRCIIGKKIERDTNRKLIRGRDVVSWKYDRDLTSLCSAVLPIGDDVETTDIITSKIKIDKKLTNSKTVTTKKIPFGTETTTVTTKYSIGVVETIIDKQYTANISGISLDMAKGDPVGKPLGNLSLEIPDLSVDYSWVDNNNRHHPRMVVKKFEGYKDPHKLAIRAWRWLLANSKPKLSVTATADKLGNVELGDLITVSDPDFHFEMKEPVSKIEHNLLSELDSIITVGTYSVKSMAARFHEQKQAMDKDAYLKRRALRKLRKKLNDLSNKLNGAGADAGTGGTGSDTGTMSDTTGRFAMHFDPSTPNKVLTAKFNYDSGAKLGFDGTQFTMTNDIGGTVGSMDHTGLLTAAEIDAGTVKSPQLDGEGKGSLIAHYSEIGQINAPIGKVYAKEFDPIAVWPDGHLQVGPETTASFQSDHLQLNEKVTDVYGKQSSLTSDGLDFSYPLVDGKTGSYGNQKVALTLSSNDLFIPKLLISKGNNEALLTPMGLYFNGKNILELAGGKTELPDNVLTSDGLGGALNSLSSAMVNGSKILTEQSLSDIFQNADTNGDGSYTPLVESLMNLVISHDFMDAICRELDGRGYAKISDIPNK